MRDRNPAQPDLADRVNGWQPDVTTDPPSGEWTSRATGILWRVEWDGAQWFARRNGLPFLGWDYERKTCHATGRRLRWRQFDTAVKQVEVYDALIARTKEG